MQKDSDMLSIGKFLTMAKVRGKNEGWDNCS